MKERLTLKNFYRGNHVEWEVSEVMCHLYILESDIMQNTYLHSPSLQRGPELAFKTVWETLQGLPHFLAFLSSFPLGEVVLWCSLKTLLLPWID